MDEVNDSGKNAAKRAALLLVIGEPFSEESKNLILAEITKGFRCWDAEESGIDINDELAQIANRADLGEEGPCVSPYGHQLKEGERIIRHQSERLAVEILVSPQKTSLTRGVKNFLTTPTTYKHIIYAGHAFQGSGAWIMQDDTYTFSNFAQAFKDEVVADTLKNLKDTSLVIYTTTQGDWTTGHIVKSEFSKIVNVKLNPADKLEDIHGVLQFSAYVSNFVKVRQLNELLKSSDVVGNIKFSRPTMYIFPACQGDSALFGINGFNLLVNGGYSRKACFWDFTRHLDRIDAALMTHLGTDNLFGFSKVLQRKSMENLHPEIGFMYVNATDTIKSPVGSNDSKEDTLQVNLAEEGHKLIQYARQIGPAPQPVSRSHAGQSIEPVNLFQKVGIGSLDMYILNPVTDSKELKEFYQQWNQNVAQFGSNWHMPLPNLLSVCVLVVWKPSDPNDNITRVFFPGNAPQHKLLEGLEKLKNMDFLKQAECTRTSLSAKPSRKPAGLPKQPAKPKVSPATTPRNETPKKEIKEAPVQKSSTPKTKSAPPPAMKTKKEKEDVKKEKEDVNKKASKTTEKAKPEKTDKPKKTTSPSKASSKKISAAVPKKGSPVKEAEQKPEPDALVPDLIDTAPLAEESALNGSLNEEGSSVDPQGFSSELLEPTHVPDDPESLIDISSSSVPEQSAEAEQEQDNGHMDKQKMRELGIYDEDQDIEQDLDAQQTSESPEEDMQPQMYGGMTDSMHQDLMDDAERQNVMQGSYHADLMTGSMHEAMFENNQPFDDKGYFPNGGDTIEEAITPEDDKSEEIQPQALPEPVPYAPESYGQEPDVIPTMVGKEEPQIVDKSDDTPIQEPDLLMGKQETKQSFLDEDSTVPVDEKHGFLTPDEVENNLPEDFQEKDISEETEKELAEIKQELNEDDELKVSDEMMPAVQQHADHQNLEDLDKDEDSIETREFIELEKNGEMLQEQVDEAAGDVEETQSEQDVSAADEKDQEDFDDVPPRPQSQEIPDDLERPESPEPDSFEQEKLMPEQSGDLMQSSSNVQPHDEADDLEDGYDDDMDHAVAEKEESQEDVVVSDVVEKQDSISVLQEKEGAFFERQNLADERPLAVTGTVGMDDPTEDDAARIDSGEMPDSEEERAESPDSQKGAQDSSRDSLEKEVGQEPTSGYDEDAIEQEADENTGMPSGEDIDEPCENIEKEVNENLLAEKRIDDFTAENEYDEHHFEERRLQTEDTGYDAPQYTDDYEQRDSAERSLSPEEPEEINEDDDRETEDKDLRVSEERSISPEQRHSADKSYEEEETDESGEDSSSFDQEEATDEKCLIHDSVSDDQRHFDKGKVMEIDSQAAPTDSQQSDNLVTPESEYTDASHGGQVGYHEIDEQDGDSLECAEEKDNFMPHQGHQMHPFGEGFDQFASGYSSGPVGGPFDMPVQQGRNPFAEYEGDASRDDEENRLPHGGPSGFNPLAEWGEPMGLPSPAPPEEKTAAAQNQKGVPKTKPANRKKAPASDEMKKPEPKKSVPPTKKPASATKPVASNGVPEKSKSRPSTGASESVLNTSKVAATGSLNSSRLSTVGKAKPRPASAPAKDVTDNKTAKNGTKRPATAAGTRSVPAVSKLPPLPAFTPFYVDLTYIPNHGNPAYCDVEFFKRVRARYYVLSALVPNTDTLDALFEGKKTWEDKNVTTTIIPTYDHENLRAWMIANRDELAEHKIEVAPSASRCSIQLQDQETSSLAFRLEF